MLHVSCDQLLAIALQHHQAGRLIQAEQTCRQILQQQPDHAQALHQLGLLAMQTSRPAAAVELFRRACAICPADAACHNNLGYAQQANGQNEQAILSYRAALRLQGDLVGAHYNLGNALLARKDFAPAAACFRRALELDPSLAEAHNHLGIALQAQGCVHESITSYRAALRLQPENVQALYNLGSTLNTLGQVDEAIACLRQALRLKPDFADAHNNLGAALKDLGRLDEALACRRRAMDLQPQNAAYHSNLILSLHYHPAATAASINAENRRWNERHALPARPLIQSHPNDRRPDRRLRIGYVSADFRHHPSANFLFPLFRNHDPHQVEIVCYSQGTQDDQTTRAFQNLAALWREIAGLSDAAVAQMIRADQIDILVDLKLHTGFNRLPLFAHKPAPVQATWLGYPGSTGLDAMDYRLTDPYLDPPGEHDGDYCERSIRLPDCFWCYDPLTAVPPVNALPALTQGRVTFGCLNNFCKLNDGVIELWAQLLSAVEDAHLLMLAPQGSAPARVLELFSRAGIATQRVEFVARESRTRYLQLYQGIDIGLDTFPYNGHTTSLDSLWMGVPVITLVGHTIVGRAGFSQLMNLGLPQWVARTPAQYVQIAADLARDLPRLSEYRAALRPRMQQSPLMDAPRFARHVESAYRWMWAQWCAAPAGPS